MNPKVSIIIPCYNTEKWIEECIDSVFSQSYGNIEVIAVDNESTDNTFSILQKMKEKYPDLILDSVPNIYRHSWDEPRERGLELSNGDYVTIICSDDYISEHYIENCMKYISVSPEKILALQSPIKNIRNGVDSGIQIHQYTSLSEFKEKALNYSPVNTPTVIYNRKLYNQGLLKTNPEKYYGAADYDLYCRLADNNVLIYPADKWLGYNYRWHAEQCTWGMHKEPVKYDKLIQEFWRAKWTS